MLPSGFTEGQTWGGSYKAWMAFIIANSNEDQEKKEYYAAVIQKLQKELEIIPSQFYDLRTSSLGFHLDNFTVINILYYKMELMVPP